MPSLSPTISKALLRVKVRIRHPIHHRDYLNRSTPDLAAIPNSKDYNPAPQPEVEVEPATPLSYTPASSVQDLTSQNNVISSAVNTVPYVRSRASSIGSLPGAKPDTSKATRTRPPIQKRGSTAPVQALAESFKADGTGRKFVWVGLKALVQVVECGADIFPVLKLAVTGLSQCIGIFEAAATNRREFVDLHKKLDLLLKALVPFINRQWPTNQKMTGYVMNLATGILEEVKALKEKHGKAIANRLMQTVEDQNEILGYYNRIRDHLDVFKLCAALHLYETVEQQGEDAYLAKLSPVKSAVYNSGQLGKIKRRACTAGTRMAELHKLRNWAYNSDPSAQGICWMNGMAGTGKTTIAYSLCTELDDSKMLGASFFCSRLDSNCQEVTDILPSIAYQLAQFSTPFRYALLQVLKSEPDVHTLLLQKQFDSLLVKPLMEIRRLRGSSPDFVVVIDALDECEDKDSVGKILDLLLGHDDLPIRFLISSRPEREIEDRMMNKVGERFDALLVLHRLDASAVAQDIETYLEDELKDVGFTPSQLKALVERSGVLFIFAATAAQYIKAGYTLRKHTERLEVILGLKDGPNEGLDSLYSTILNLALYHSDLDESDRRDITIVLHTVTCAQEPMSIGALSGLLRQDEEQVVCLLRLLSSVLHIAEETGQKIVAPLHASFPDFMLDKARSDLFHCDPEINHQRMAEACFWIIKNNNPQFNICHLESSYDLDIEVTDIGERVAKHVSPQLFYACQYWMNHLELGGQNETLLNSLHDFLFTRLLLWIEVLNLKKSLNLGAEIMEQAENWGMEQGWSKDIIEMVHDAWRFVTMFASNPVSQSTPHLYVSMLPFWPKPSPIHQHYTSRAQNLINPQGTAMVRRRPALLADWYFDVKIECPSFSEDGSQIVFGLGKDMYIRDGSTGELIAGPLKGHTKTISSACFSSDGLRVVSGSWDKTVRVWDVQSGETVVGPLQHTSSVESVAYSPDGTCIAAGGWDKEVVVWDLKTCKAISELKGHTSLVTSIAFSPNGKLIASGSSDKTVRVWDFRSENPCLYVLSGHTRLIKALDFSCDSKRIVSGSWDTTAQVWDVESGMAIGGPLRGHSASIHVTRFCSDGLHVLTGSSDKTICMWDAQTGEMVNSPFEGHGGSITSVWCSPDRTRIVSCAKDKVVRIWDARSKQTLFSPLQGHTDEVTSITCSSDGKRVVSGSFDNTVCVWDTQSGDMVLGPLQKHTHSVNSVAFSADGARVISAAQDKSVGMWCTQDGGMVLGWLEGHNKPVNSVAFSPDGATIASGSDDCIIQIWDANGGNTVTASLKAHIEPVNSVAFSFDGARLVSGSSDRTIRVWDLGSGETLVGPIIGHSGAVLSVAFSSDGTRIVSGSSDHTVRVWDARSGTMIFPPLMGHTDGVNSVAFSFDGTKIASGSDDWTIRLWDGESGKMILEPFEGHTEPVNSVTFSPDGAYIYSGSADDTIRAWDIRSGQIGAYQSRDDQTHITVENNELGGCHNPWRLDRGGWVVDSDSQRLLAWVPPDLRVSLLRPRNSFLISTQGSVKLDLSSAKIGPSWVDCEPSS